MRGSQRDPTTYRPFIYGLVDPDDIGHIRYVGMAPSRATRPYDHATAARKERTKDTHQIRWIRKLQAAGRDYLVTILEETPQGTDRVVLGARETHWILTLRGHGHRLTNENDGGWGGSNGPHSEEARQRMRDGWTQEVRERVGNASRERGTECMRTTEAREAMSRASKGRSKSEEHRRNIAEAKRKSWAEGKYDSPEYHKKLSDAAIASGHSAAIGHANLGKRHTDEARAQMSLSQKGNQNSLGFKHSTETRAKRSAALKTAWARRKAALALLTPAEKLQRSIDRNNALILKLRKQIETESASVTGAEAKSA
jgi:hypothetical protein